MSYVWIFPLVTLTGLLKEAEVTTVQIGHAKVPKNRLRHKSVLLTNYETAT